MTSKEFEQWIESYKAEVKETKRERPLTDDEIDEINENIKNIPEKYRSKFELTDYGEYGMFEKLPYLLRNYFGAIEFRKFTREFGPNPSLEDERVQRYLEDNIMNAALRAGISANKNAGGETARYAKELDSYMNAALMKRTMQPITEGGIENLDDIMTIEQRNRAIEKNKATQLVMAKTMLLAQVGKYDVINENNVSTELTEPIYETLVHGARTNFVLPTGKDGGNVINAFKGPNGGADAGIDWRFAATHSVKLRSISKNGALGSDTKEERTYNPLKVIGYQYGMDIAAGGLGRKGPDGRVIQGNGPSGHLYMRAQKGDDKHCGSLLVGIEGSAPGSDSYLGNSHGILAKSAKQSAFIADKSIVGNKIGGRQVDLSGVSSGDLAHLLNEFSEKYGALQQNGNTPEGREKLEKINNMLMGKRLDMKAITEMLGELGMSSERNLDIITRARGGYLSKTNASAMTEEEFKQSVRSCFSQDNACGLAEARFKSAGDNIELAVGAVKELMFTHETRSLKWKIFHPIKNYFENSKISELKERLISEKHFKAADIASSMRTDNDTFDMNWGEGLSYDRDALKFARENAGVFKPSQNKLRGVLEAAYGELQSKAGKDSAPTKDATVKKAPVHVDGRVKVMITEVNTNEKETEKSQRVMPEQPTQNKSKNI